MNKYRTSILLTALAVAFPSVAHADAGVPMLFLVMPAFGFSLVPIVLIEALYLQRQLTVSFRSAGISSLLANAASTFVGIPISWIGLVVLQLVTDGGGAYGLDSTMGRIAAVTWQAPWLIPYESDLHWMIPVAGTVLLIPFFYVSWWVEYRVCLKRFADVPASKLNMVVRNANLITYGLLLLWPATFYLKASA